MSTLPERLNAVISELASIRDELKPGKPDPKPDPRPEGKLDWTKAMFPGGKGPYHKRPGILYGYMATTAFDSYRRATGCNPDIGGGLTSEDESWTSIMGGDYSKGATFIQPRSMVDWANAGNTELMMQLEGAVVVPHGAIIPYDLSFEDAVKIANGTFRFNGISYDDMMARRGERVKNHCKQHGKSLDLIVERPAHEFNGTTKFVVQKFNGEENFWKVGLAKGYKKDEILEVFQQIFSRFAKNTWKGAGQKISTALSPQMQNPPGVPWYDYEEFMSGPMGGVIRMVCGSVHPNPDRAKDETTMRAWIHSETLANAYTLGKALKAAKWATERGNEIVKCGTLEWSPVHKSSNNKNLFERSMANYPKVVDVVYDMIENPAHRNHMFAICMHAPHNCFDPNELNGQTSAENIAFWKEAVERMRRRHSGAS